MPLVFDAVLVSALARELDVRLRHARLRALRLDRPGRALSLLFREGTLRFDLAPDAGSVRWHDAVDPAPGDRPFAARLDRVDAGLDDRVLRLSLRRARGSAPAVEVLVDWVTNRWNAVVCEGTEGADKVVRQVLVEIQGERAPRTGHPWIPPPPSVRIGVDGDLSSDRWRGLLLDVEPSRRRSVLLREIAWSSPLNAASLLGAATDEDGQAAERALDAGHRLWLRLSEIALGRHPVTAALLRTERGRQPYPLPLPDLEHETAPSLLEAFAGAGEHEGSAPPLPAALLDALAERGVRAWARVASLREALAEAEEPGHLRSVGDVLLARLGQVPRGEERVRLLDFAGHEVEIDLDPRLTAADNAAAYYDRATRAERARARLPALVEAAETEARRLDLLLEGARARAVTVADLTAELPAGSGRAAPGGQAPGLPYRTYRSSGGMEIRVGRGARHNDDLTFHHSAPNDVWLHARHAAGAHVVLRWGGEGSPPARDLGEAAVLAALHSQARTSGSVPVDWTRRKYVRKPRKAPPGQVLMERAKTLFVEPDAALEERLRED